MENNLQRIGNVAEHYGISTRTLRYYEDMGIIKSIRDSNTKCRFYDYEVIEKLEQIMVLKNLGLTIEEIGGVLKSHEDAVKICKLKLANIHKIEAELTKKKRLINSLLHLLTGKNKSDELSILSACKFIKREMQDQLVNLQQ